MLAIVARYVESSWLALIFWQADEEPILTDTSAGSDSEPPKKKAKLSIVCTRKRLYPLMVVQGTFPNALTPLPGVTLLCKMQTLKMDGHEWLAVSREGDDIVFERTTKDVFEVPSAEQLHNQSLKAAHDARLLQLPRALEENAKALKLAAETGELAEIGALYLERNKLTAELERSSLSVQPHPSDCMVVRQQLRLPLGTHLLADGQLMVLQADDGQRPPLTALPPAVSITQHEPGVGSLGIYSPNDTMPASDQDDVTFSGTYFSSAHDVCFDSTGTRLFVSNDIPGCVYVFDLTGKLLHTLGNLTDAGFLALNPRGELYVEWRPTNATYRCISVFQGSPPYSLLFSFALSDRAWAPIACTAEGRLVAGCTRDNQGILAFYGADNKLSHDAPIPVSAWSLTVDPQLVASGSAGALRQYTCTLNRAMFVLPGLFHSCLTACATMLQPTPSSLHPKMALSTSTLAMARCSPPLIRASRRVRHCVRLLSLPRAGWPVCMRTNCRCSTVRLASSGTCVCSNGWYLLRYVVGLFF